jgi:hypothetical protein
VATREQIIALAAAVWPDAANITVHDFAAGHVEWAGPDPPTSGFVLLANDGSGGIIQRVKADTLDELQDEVEKLRKSNANPNE